MPSAQPAGGAVPYDAYSSDHLHGHPQQQPSHRQHAGSPTVRQQPWYEMSDGAVTPPDDSSSSSHRGDFISHMAAGLPLPHGVTATRRRPLGCWMVVNVCIDLLILASLAVAAYFLRYYSF